MRKKEDYDTENQLEHVSEKLSALCDGIEESIYVSDPETFQVLFANQKLKELVGEKILGKKCYKIFQNLNEPCPFCTNKYIFGENLGKTHIWEFQNRKSKRWYRCVDKAIEWPKGKHVRFEMAIDITKHKEMEEALRESEEKWRTLAEQSPNMIFINKKGRVVYANKKCEEIMGYNREDFYSPDFNFLTLIARESKDVVKANFSRHMNGEDFAPYEYTLVTREGKRIEAIITPKLIRHGKESAILGIITDITERKKMEEALKKSEEQFRSVVENSHDGIVILDDNFRIIYANDQCASIGGNSREEILGQDFREFLGKESKLIEERYLRRQNGEKTPTTYELEIVRKDGEERDIKVRSATTKDSQGRVFTIAQVLDITDLKRMEKERENFEERLSTLHTYAHSLNMAENLKEITSLTLDAMEKTLGFEYASIMLVEGKLLRMVAQRGYSRGLMVTLSLDGKKGVTVKAARTGKPVLVPNLRKEKAYVEGGFGMLSELAVPIRIRDEVLGVLNVESRTLAAFNEKDEELLEILASHAAISISDMQKHKQLRKLSKKLANLMKSSTEIMRIKDMQKRLKVIAKAIRKFGWRRVVISLRDENLEGKDLVTAGLTKDEIKLLLERKAPGHIWRERLGLKFEQFKIGEFYYLPWSDPWIREYVHDVPPEASIEEATTYTGVPSTLPLEEMVDWHPQDMLYAPLRTPEGRIVGILSMDDPVDGRKPTRKSLTPLELFLHQAAIVIENAQLIGSLREAREQLEAYAGQLEKKVEERTCELKKSQEKLLKAQRLAVIGELAGMVGHDLRNPLTGIAGAAYYLKKRLSSGMDKKTKEMLELIENNIVYSNKIINDLLDYSRELKLDLTVADPKSIVGKSLSLVKIPKNVHVIDLTENKPKMNVDVGKMKRAFVNIIRNSVDAMPKGGTLTIKAKKLDGNVEFVFSDTGIGMSKKNIEKLWTPLFTTKAKGMGFGLAICKRVIEAHGGSISVKSARAKGTTFTMTIPTKPKVEGGEKIWVKPPESSLLTTTKA